MAKIVTTKNAGLAGTGLTFVAFALGEIGLPREVVLLILGLGVAMVAYAILRSIFGTGIDDLKGWSVSAQFGPTVSFVNIEPPWGMIGFQGSRISNLSTVQTRHIEFELHFNPGVPGAKQIILRAPDEGRTEYRRSIDRMGHDSASRRMKHIPNPLALAPSDCVEGQIEFQLDQVSAAELSAMGPPPLSIVMIDMRTGQSIEIPWGMAYDADAGKVIEPQPIRLGPGTHTIAGIRVPELGIAPAPPPASAGEGAKLVEGRVESGRGGDGQFWGAGGGGGGGLRVGPDGTIDAGGGGGGGGITPGGQGGGPLGGGGGGAPGFPPGYFETENGKTLLLVWELKERYKAESGTDDLPPDDWGNEFLRERGANCTYSAKDGVINLRPT